MLHIIKKVLRINGTPAGLVLFFLTGIMVISAAAQDNRTVTDAENPAPVISPPPADNATDSAPPEVQEEPLSAREDGSAPLPPPDSIDRALIELERLETEFYYKEPLEAQTLSTADATASEQEQDAVAPAAAPEPPGDKAQPPADVVPLQLDTDTPPLPAMQAAEPEQSEELRRPDETGIMDAVQNTFKATADTTLSAFQALGSGLTTAGQKTYALSRAVSSELKDRTVSVSKGIGKGIKRLFSKVKLTSMDWRKKQGIDRWDVIAAAFALKVSDYLDQTPESTSRHIFVTPGENTAFEQSYHDLLKSRLIQNNCFVSAQETDGQLKINFQSKVLNDRVFITTALKENGRILVQASDVSPVRDNDWRYYMENVLMDPSTQKAYKRYKLVDRE